MEYDVPEELAEFMDKVCAFEDLRDEYIKFTFGFKRAKKCAEKMHYYKRKFWLGVNEIYPELKGKSLVYSFTKQKVIKDV